MTPIRNGSHRFVPCLEGLEAREVPAVQIFATDHVLHVIGDGHADSIHVQDNGRGTITVNSGNEHFTVSGIDRVVIATGSGADKLSYNLTGPLEIAESITVRLGKGADTASLNFSDGVAAKGHLKLTVDGGSGADTEWVKIGSIAKGGSAVVDMDGGKGRDTLTFHSIGRVGGHLTAMIDGGSGHNTENVLTEDRISGTGSIDVRVS